MAYYQHSLSRTQEPPNLTEYKLFHYNYVGTTSVALTIYEHKTLGTLNPKKYYVIVEDETTYDMFYVNIRIEDKRRKFEPFEPKAMVEQVTRIVSCIITRGNLRERAADKSATWNFVNIKGCTN